LGLIYSGILYYHNRKADFSKKLLYLLSALRFAAVLIISFLLLSPMLEKNFSNEEKPVIIIAQDNSSSIVIGKDSVYYKNEYQKKVNSLFEDLEKSYFVKTYSFGDQLKNGLTFSFKDKQTDFQSLFNELLIRYSNRNVGALIIASDGLYNKGLNPVFAAENISFPVYTIALGDTTIQKDLFITKVNHNSLTYLGNHFPIEIIIEAAKCNGQTTKFTVSEGGEVLHSQIISITSNNFTKTLVIQLEAKKTGTHKYHIAFEPLNNEVIKSNNYRDIFVDVIDKKQKILLLANAPHPDIAALKQSIMQNENYDVDVVLFDNFNKTYNNYNLIILHQLPSIRFSNQQVINAMTSSDIPILFIIGEQSNVVDFNKQKLGLNIPLSKQSQNEALPALNAGFSLFTINDDLKKIINNLPPLSSPFGDYSVGATCEVLFYQKIGNVTTRKPLILFNQLNDKKVGVIVGEGYWKWRFMNYLLENNHLAIDLLTNKIIQYLSVKSDKRPFRVLSKTNFQENEAVELNAELYNESNELINIPEVEITIINENNKRFPFTFNKTSNAYTLNAGIFPVGEYKYEAKVKLGGKTYNANGLFTVSELKVEFTNTVADHQLMYLLAKKHDGEMFFPADINKIPAILQKREDIKPMVYDQTKLTDIISLKWIFILILALLTIEWLLRKRSGNY
jgi:hypothetical protein